MNNAKKKFSIGISTMEMNVEEIKKIIDDYKDYIYELYFGVPLLDTQFHSRTSLLPTKNKKESIDKLTEVLNYAKQNGIKLEYAINIDRINSKQLSQAKEVIENKIDVDSVVTVECLVQEVKKLFPNKIIVASYNNRIRTKEDFDKFNYSSFDEIVFGNSALRDFNLFEYAKNKGLKTRFLINNGCSFNCLWCGEGSKFCKSIFESNLKNFDINLLYALQSTFPWELHQYYLNNPFVDRIKISSRPSNYNYINECLYRYINNINKDDLSVSKSMFCRLEHFFQYKERLNYNLINEYKKEIWLTNK